MLIWLGALLLAAAPPAGWTGKVSGVADGDTVEVMRAGAAVRVRLFGIDSPERNQPFGTRARQMAAKLAFGQTVQVRPRSQDRFGRVVAEVILPDGTSLNETLVGQGMAWWYRDFARRETRLRLLEEQAREQRLGLWADSDPVPPWVWRKTARSRARPAPANKGQ
jgi:endonuclease YncB( thermonuclease family)